MVTQVSEFTYYVFTDQCNSLVDDYSVAFVTANTVSDYQSMVIDQPIEDLSTNLSLPFFSNLFSHEIFFESTKTISAAALHNEFMRLFPAGIIYKPELSLGPKRACVSEYEATELFPEIRQQLAFTHPEEHQKIGVCVLYINDTIHTVFVIKNQYLPKHKLRLWSSLRAKIERYNILNSVGKLSLS